MPTKALSHITGGFCEKFTSYSADIVHGGRYRVTIAVLQSGMPQNNGVVMGFMCWADVMGLSDGSHLLYHAEPCGGYIEAGWELSGDSQVGVESEKEEV